MVKTLVAAIIVAGSVWQTAKPADPVYDVVFTLPDSTVYSGSTTFVVDAKNVVTGRMDLTVPTVVTATLAGNVKDGVWTFTYPYTIPAQQCSGTVEGTAKAPADRKVITGTATILGACVPQPQTTTFTFTRREK